MNLVKLTIVGRELNARKMIDVFVEPFDVTMIKSDVLMRLLTRLQLKLVLFNDIHGRRS